MKSRRGNVAAVWLVVAFLSLGIGTAAASPRGEMPAIDADGQPVAQHLGEPNQSRPDSDQFLVVCLASFAIAVAATALLPSRDLADQ